MRLCYSCILVGFHTLSKSTDQTIFMEEKLVNLEVGEGVFFFNVTPVASPKNVL